jgi:hypothetical protein
LIIIAISAAMGVLVTAGELLDDELEAKLAEIIISFFKFECCQTDFWKRVMEQLVENTEMVAMPFVSLSGLIPMLSTAASWVEHDAAASADDSETAATHLGRAQQKKLLAAQVRMTRGLVGSAPQCILTFAYLLTQNNWNDFIAVLSVTASMLVAVYAVAAEAERPELGNFVLGGNFVKGEEAKVKAKATARPATDEEARLQQAVVAAAAALKEAKAAAAAAAKEAKKQIRAAAKEEKRATAAMQAAVAVADGRRAFARSSASSASSGTVAAAAADLGAEAAVGDGAAVDGATTEGRAGGAGSSRLHVPSARERTSAAQLLVAGVLPTEDLRDLAPCYGVGRYDYGGQEAVETTAAALAACGPGCSLPVGPGVAAGTQELREVPGALLLPDRTGPGASARTQDGKHLFVAAELMDLSGSCQVRIAEEPGEGGGV